MDDMYVLEQDHPPQAIPRNTLQFVAVSERGGEGRGGEGRGGEGGEGRGGEGRGEVAHSMGRERVILSLVRREGLTCMHIYRALSSGLPLPLP